MTRADILKKLSVIFRNNFCDGSIILTDETSSIDIEDWDSLEQISLVVAIQDEFRIKFKVGEIDAMKNVGEMVDLILKKIGG